MGYPLLYFYSLEIWILYFREYTRKQGKRSTCTNSKPCERRMDDFNHHSTRSTTESFFARIYSTNLRCLLDTVASPKSFEELCYVDGIRYNPFYDACIYRGLIEDRNARDWKLDIAATRDEQMSCCSQQRPTYA
jgi:hypothetical protein